MEDLQPTWDENERLLEKSLQMLSELPGFLKAHAEIEKALKSFQRPNNLSPPVLKAIDLLDAHAGPMVALVVDAATRNAFLVVLRDSYYATTHLALLGFRSASQARRFGGGFGRATSPGAIQNLERLNARYRFWVSEAVKRGGEPKLSQAEMEEFEVDEDKHLGLLRRPLRAKVKLIDAEYKTRLNQRVDRHTVICESLQKCFDVLVEDAIAQSQALTFQMLSRTIPSSLLEIAVELRWLPRSMSPDNIGPLYRTWLWQLIDGRIAYFEAVNLGAGSLQPKPSLVVIPDPVSNFIGDDLGIDSAIPDGEYDGRSFLLTRGVTPGPWIVGGNDSEFWRSKREQFTQLYSAEIEALRGISPDRRYRALVTFDDRTLPFGSWKLFRCIDETISTRFNELGTSLGVKLGAPAKTTPFEYWLYCVWDCLLASESKLLEVASRDGGFIKDVLEASIICCSIYAKEVDEYNHLNPKCHDRDPNQSSLEPLERNAQQSAPAERRAASEQGEHKAFSAGSNDVVGGIPDFSIVGKTTESSDDSVNLSASDMRITVDQSAAPASRKRGRPAKIDPARKDAALAARARSESWSDVAKILYNARYPTIQQVKNAGNILKHYTASKSRLEST